MREAVFGLNSLSFPISDGCVVYYRVELAKLVDLIGDAVHLRNARQIPDDDCFRSRCGGQSLLAPPLVASMQDYAVSLLDEELSGHTAEAVGRTCNEYPGHIDVHNT